MKTLLVLTSILFIGCATNSQISKKSSAVRNVRQIDMDKKAIALRAKQDKEQARQESARIATRRSLLGPSMITSLPQKQGRLEMAAPNSILNNKLTEMSEGELVAEIKDRYAANDRIGFQNRVQAFLNRPSARENRDEVLYIRGLMELNDKNYGMALVQLNTLLRESPNSKRAASVLFAKGILFGRMHLVQESQQVLTQVISRFPGSVEAMRAKLEMKAIKR